MPKIFNRRELQNYSYDDLMVLQRDINDVVQEQAEFKLRVDNAKSAIDKILEENNITLEEIYGDGGSKASAPKRIRQVLYSIADPENGGDYLWSSAGRVPKLFAPFLEGVNTKDKNAVHEALKDHRISREAYAAWAEEKGISDPYPWD